MALNGRMNCILASGKTFLAAVFKSCTYTSMSPGCCFAWRWPYVGGLSHDFKSKIVKLFYDELRIDIVPVFNTFKVSNYFTLKSRTPKLLMANVVYKFTCLCDTNLTYIGKTKRHLAVRSLEHLEFKSENPKSEVKVHLKSCQTCQNCNSDNFEVLKKCKNDHENKICEAMFIKSENPKLNKNLFNKGSFVTLKIYY